VKSSEFSELDLKPQCLGWLESQPCINRFLHLEISENPGLRLNHQHKGRASAEVSKGVLNFLARQAVLNVSGSVVHKNSQRFFQYLL
jgi:hypothetical protein